MATEYIERGEAIDALKKDVMGGLNYRRILNSIPATDVQPIVRCKDCKHFHLDYFGKVNGANIIVAHEICDLWAGGCKTVQNAFCSNGVRKDGEP